MELRIKSLTLWKLGLVINYFKRLLIRNGQLAISHAKATVQIFLNRFRKQPLGQHTCRPARSKHISKINDMNIRSLGANLLLWNLKYVKNNVHK
jgi:hypothetical protein